MGVAATADYAAPRAIGPYEIQCEIGRGGMGVVYRATRLYDGAQVALKIASAGMADMFSFIRREIQTLRRLRNPGVVRILDEGAEKGVPWYVMELLDAHSLGELLGLSEFDGAVTDLVRPFIPVSGAPAERASGRTPVRADLPRVLTLMYRLARVLAHIHGHGVSHRDIKPQNVLVRPGDRPVLVDFGLVGRFNEHGGREVLEISGQMLGTALYASPEQASGELVDARSDLYSFGVMLYEIVTGRPPFDGFSINEILSRHLTHNPVRPSQVVDRVPPALDELIMRLLEKRRAERLGYAEDVAALLVEAGAQRDPDFDSDTAPYLYRPQIVGRCETVEALRAYIPEIRKGRGAFVVIGGESGIGKTSVASVLAREATFAGLNVIAGECQALAGSGDMIGGPALHPLQPLFREIADHCRAGGRAAIESILGRRLAVLRDQDPSLEALVDLRADDTPRIPPEIASRRLFTDVTETLAAFACARPLVLVIDDLQWADEVTVRFLSSLDEEFFAKTSLMILGTYRADEAEADLRALLARQHIVKMPLKRLDETCVHDIVRSMLAAPGAPERFLHYVAQQCEGNPFFVAEYLRAAVAERLLYREGGRWHVQSGRGRSFSDLGLPRTLRTLVARRLGSLSAAAGRLVEAAAVLGRDVDESLLIATCGESPAEAQTAISELLELYVMDPSDRGIRFAHDKLREAAYDRIAPGRLAALHARTAEAIEAACADEDARRAHAAALAHHWDIAGNAAKAIHYYSIAGQNAVDTGACREAKDLIQRAINLDARDTGAEPQTERRTRHARWHRQLGQAWLGLGDLARAAEQTNESLELLGTRVPRTSAGWHARLLLEVMRQATHLLLPRRMYRARAAKAALLTELTRSAQLDAELLFYTTREVPMLASALLSVNRAERVGGSAGSVVGYYMLGFACGTLGLQRLENHYLTRARRVATAMNDVAGQAMVMLIVLQFSTTRCDWQRAAAAAADARSLARRCSDSQVIELVEINCGHYEFYSGRMERSAETYARLGEYAHKRFNLQHEAWARVDRARALIYMGRLDEALDGLAAAVPLADGERFSEIAIAALRATALLHLDRLDEAVEAADKAHALAADTNPTFFEMLRAFSAPAEVYLEVPRMRGKVKTVLRKLRGYTRRTPIVHPTCLRLAGMARCVGGDVRGGTILLRKSAAAAARLGLQLDEGIALYELASRTPDEQERAECRDRARSLFNAIGCELYLRKMT